MYRIVITEKPQKHVKDEFGIFINYGITAMEVRNRSIPITWTTILPDFLNHLRRKHFIYPKDVWEFDKYWAVQPHEMSPKHKPVYNPHFLPETHLAKLWDQSMTDTLATVLENTFALMS